MKAIGYARVSTDKQADHGVSLDAQAEKIRAMAVVQGAELVEVVIDGGASAKSLDRPGLDRVLQMIDRREIDVLIVAKLDRLTRSVKDLAELLEQMNKRGVALVSVAESLDTGSAAGRLVLNIMTAVSQWEREAIGERTRDALQHKKGKGERLGNIPFGYRASADGRHIEECPVEMAVVQKVNGLRASGQSLREIAEALNAEGITTRRGSAWRHEYVAPIVKAGQERRRVAA
jgi:DNA invertase Pin-like site-specific DNA recombinase